MFLKPVLLTAGVSLLATGCVVREEVRYRNPPPAVVVQPGPVASGEVVVNGAPPDPIVEVQPLAPDPTFVWIGGFWAWHGRWVWEAGHWGHPPHPGAVWYGPHYVYRGGRHVWVRGYWR